jgi:hypothetical protein
MDQALDGPSVSSPVANPISNEEIHATLQALSTVVDTKFQSLSTVVDTISNQFKDFSVKQDTTTASLTTIGVEIMELKSSSSSSPDNISGLTGSTALSPAMREQIVQTVNEALIAAFSPGGVVAERCKDDTDTSMTEFGNALVSMLIPEINSTIVASLRDGCTALVKMLRSPEIMQAGEVAAIVKRELSPQMAAITTGLSRMATAVEISIGSPQGAVLGDAATHSTDV